MDQFGARIVKVRLRLVSLGLARIGTGLGKVRFDLRSYDGYLQQLAYRYRLVDQGQLIDSVPILDHRVSV